MDIKKDVNTIFTILRTLFYDDSVILHKLSQEYETQIFKDIYGIPPEYKSTILHVIKVIIALLESINFSKFSKTLEGMCFKMDSYDVALEAVNDMTNNFKKSVAKAMLLDFQLLFACLDKILENPKKYALIMAGVDKTRNDIL